MGNNTLHIAQMTCEFHIVAHAFFILFFLVNLCNFENLKKRINGCLQLLSGISLHKVRKTSLMSL
jgi:hypothetical protein